MNIPSIPYCRSLLAVALLALAFAGPAQAAEEVAQIKTVTGAAHIERGTQKIAAAQGLRLLQSDTVVTGADGAVGITFLDNTLLSAGPNSVLVIEKFAFDSTTHQGSFDASLKTGTLAVVSGKIAKQSPEAMKVRTPAAILGVRGTEFVVRTADAR